MSRVFLDLAVSLDGYISGPDGEDGGLHDWYFAAEGAATDVVDELLAGIGAIVMGRRAFGDAPDGLDTPYKVGHFVLTHEARPTVQRDGASFAFVTEGIEAALERARVAAGERDVCVAGGADVARQYLNAGLLDEIQLHQVPVLLGGGLRLFEGLAHPPIQLRRTRVIETPHATHLKFEIVQRAETETT